jgi:A/G-specific adenine glycosylase
MTEHPLTTALLKWFERNRRDLPWRETYAPYEVWISEIMLQQTQMERGVKHFRKWRERLPDVHTLAAASEEEVLTLWEGLGYYSRARNLHRAAALVVERHGGRIPETEEELLALPGIGGYTAAAILSIGFGRDVVLVDANVERLFSRQFDIDQPVRTAAVQKELRRRAAELLPQGRAREYNQALMELGGLVCRPRTPLCGECPLRESCEALRLGIVDERPVLSRPKEIVELDVVCGVLVHQGRVFIQKRLAEGVWPGLWEFPGGRIEAGESPEQAIVRELLEETELKVGGLEKIRVIRHGYTRYRVTLHCFFCTLNRGQEEPVLHAAQEYHWASPSDLGRFAFPAGHRKLIDSLKRDLRFHSHLKR